MMSVRNNREGVVAFTINAAGQVYQQTMEITHFGEAVTADTETLTLK